MAQDDSASESYNLPDRLLDFKEAVDEIAAWTQGNDIMLMMGSDMAYMQSQASVRVRARTWACAGRGVGVDVWVEGVL